MSECDSCGRAYCRKRYSEGNGCDGKDYTPLTPEQVKQRSSQVDRRIKKEDKKPIIDIGVSNDLPFKDKKFEVITMMPELLNHCDHKVKPKEVNEK